MKRLLRAAVAAGAMVSVHGAAVAADLPPVRSGPPPAPPPPAYSWTGCYLGLGGGYGMWNQEVQTQTAAGVPLSATATHGGRGWFATGQFGCDVQIAAIVIGAFGDYDYAINMKGNVTVPDRNVFGDEKLRWSWAAGARFGWLPVPQLLTFFSAGYTQARFGEINLFDQALPAVAVGQQVPAASYHGWFIGSGYEYNILAGLFWKTEYRFADYLGKRSPVLGTTEAIYAHKYIHTVRSELVWRFSFGGPLSARY